jgi:hypothetical protein
MKIPQFLIQIFVNINRTEIYHNYQQMSRSIPQKASKAFRVILWVEIKFFSGTY